MAAMVIRRTLVLRGLDIKNTLLCCFENTLDPLTSLQGEQTTKERTETKAPKTYAKTKVQKLRTKTAHDSCRTHLLPSRL
jgi:hypothetical protein